MNQQFNPNSTDAMFARIMERLDELKATTDEIRDEAKHTNGRVTSLEKEKWYQRGVAATVAVLAGAVWEWWNSR